MRFKLPTNLTPLFTRRGAVTLVLALLCNACGMNLRPAPMGQAIDLSGQWQLAISERQSIMTQLHEQLQQIQAKQMRREQKRQRRAEPSANDMGDPEPMPSPATDHQQRSGAINNWQQREQQELQTALLNAVVPSVLLKIVQTPTWIEMARDNSARRFFEAGVNSALVSSYASLKVESGWQGNEFVVHSKDAAQGLDIVERYRRDTVDRLSLRLELEMPDLKSQVFSVNYTLQARSL
ncbi:MAG: hypothetical protein AB7F79_08905 [Steroidobacteraceae bacterium]